MFVVVGIVLSIAALVRRDERRQASRRSGSWSASELSSRSRGTPICRSSTRVRSSVARRLRPAPAAAPRSGSIGRTGAVVQALPGGLGATTQEAVVLRRPRPSRRRQSSISRRAHSAFWPILYSETWGDYFGFWKWGSVDEPRTPSVERRLSAQSVVGVLPTFLAAAGLLALSALPC